MAYSAVNIKLFFLFHRYLESNKITHVANTDYCYMDNLQNLYLGSNYIRETTMDEDAFACASKMALLYVAEIIELPRDKTNNVAVGPTKTQISLGICPVRSESSLCAEWVAKGPSFLHTDSEDSDQTGRMPRLT